MGGRGGGGKHRVHASSRLRREILLGLEEEEGGEGEGEGEEGSTASTLVPG